MAAKRREQHPVGPVLRVAPLGELKVYMVTEEELEAIGRGSSGSILLNFALALLPLAGAFLITLLTTRIEALPTLVFFVSGCIICFIAGAICAILSWHFHASTSQVIEKIKNRMPPSSSATQQAQEEAAGTERVVRPTEGEGPPAGPSPSPPGSPG